MRTVIDPEIEIGWVYKVNIKLIQPVGRSNTKEEKTFETTFNLKQPETAINRAIKSLKFDVDKVETATVTMIERLTASCF